MSGGGGGESLNKKTFLERFGDHFGSFSHYHTVVHSLFPYKSNVSGLIHF